jgi:hypothetical protein
MLNKLKSDFDEIVELVKKAPAPLQETALKVILEHWFAANVVPQLPVAAPKVPVGVSSTPPITIGGVPDGIKTFLTANGITADILVKVFQPTGAGAQLLVSSLPGKGKANQLVSLSLLLCVKQAIESGNFTCTLKELRELAVHYDCYDSTNFSTILKNNKSYYKPREKGADLDLSGPGLKKAGEIIKSIAAGE